MELSLSIIIPTLNEEACIGGLLTFLTTHPEKDRFQIIVVDGGSTDDTPSIIRQYPVQHLQTKKASRAHQMNLGVVQATHEHLYFVHADIRLIPTFFSDIQPAISQGYKAGCFSYRFIDPPNPLLIINSLFTRLPFPWCRGGDQTLFITKQHFHACGGYNETYVIMEDYELLDKITDDSFKVIKKDIGVSARKYRKNTYLKVQLANLKAMKMYRRGEDPAAIRAYYQAALD